MKILITCPPMLGMKDDLLPLFEQKGIEAVCPDVKQTLSEDELCNLIPECDGWIIGDDPATHRVFETGVKGKLKAAVKWGIGVDNIDFNACKKFNIPITNTPGMFGAEVADIALGYIIGLARETFRIDRNIRKGKWPKYRGISLANKVAGIVGHGDIGSNLAKRLIACDMKVISWDPGVVKIEQLNVSLFNWPEQINKCDFIIFTCSLNESNYHMFNLDTLNLLKPGVRIVNIARGQLLDEEAIIKGLDSNIINSAALDVMEQEPLPMSSPLRKYENCIFGSHNSSNTSEAVLKTSKKAISIMLEYLDIS